MKSKDFFSKLKETGKIDAEDFVKMLDTIPDFEIPDTAFKAFEEKFMTFDRAVAHPEIVNRLRSSNLDPVDSQLDEVLKFIDSVDKTSAVEISGYTRQTKEGEKKKDTYKQLKAIAEHLPKIFERAKATPGDNEDLKKQLEVYKKQVNGLGEKLKNTEAEYTGKLSAKDKEFEETMRNYKLETTLESLSKNYTFAEAYEKNRPALTKAILGDLKAKNHLAYAENDGEKSIQVMELKDGVPIPKFNGNSKVTVDSLLDEAFKPYLKQSGGSPTPGQHTHKVDPNQPQIRKGVRTTVQ